MAKPTKTKQAKASKKATPTKKGSRSKREVEEEFSSSEDSSDFSEEESEEEYEKGNKRGKRSKSGSNKKSRGDDIAALRKEVAALKKATKASNKDQKPKKEWELADAAMTDAASTLSRYKGLKRKQETLDKQLTKAVDPLYASGEKKYKEALALIEKLSPEDTEKFWKAQERNKNAKSYEELLTKKAWKDMHPSPTPPPAELTPAKVEDPAAIITPVPDTVPAYIDPVVPAPEPSAIAPEQPVSEAPELPTIAPEQPVADIVMSLPEQPAEESPVEAVDEAM